jgi:ubiquinone/menaquinone biosynthesis C-methylase UbiE
MGMPGTLGKAALAERRTRIGDAFVRAGQLHFRAARRRQIRGTQPHCNPAAIKRQCPHLAAAAKVAIAGASAAQSACDIARGPRFRAIEFLQHRDEGRCAPLRVSRWHGRKLILVRHMRNGSVGPFLASAAICSAKWEIRAMTDATQFQFTNPSVPKAYDEFFVPRIFEPWAKLLLDQASLQPGESVLDIATGPGTVARLAAQRLGSQGRVMATDIAPLMLEIARGKPTVGDAAAIEYRESPACPLPFANATFDVVLCQQGVQFFPDRPAALREMHRVLRPDGRAAIAVWAELQRNQLFAAFHAALQATVSSEIANLLTAPFSWTNGGELIAVTKAAGFSDVTLLTVTKPTVFEGGLDQVLQAFSATPVSPNVVALPQAARDAFFARARQELSALVKDGTVVSDLTSNIIVARR